jgi:hypothetical protein
MFLQLFSLILLIGSVFAALLPSQNDYDGYKNQIISLSKKSYKKHVKIMREENDDFYDLTWSLFDINANELLDLLHAEYSDKVLAIIFFAYSRYYNSFLVFDDISSLSHLKGSPRKDIQLKKIFQHFRLFLLKTFIRVKKKCFCSDSPNRSTGFDLLRKFESFWDNRLAHLARQLLSKEEFVEESKQFKSRIRFLDTFLNNDLESLMIYEFKRLHKVFQNIEIKNPTSVENFIFLARHLGSHSTSLYSPDCYKWLSLIASQIPEFIVFLFYFYKEPLVADRNRSDRNQFFTSKNIQSVSQISCIYFSWDKITLKLFGISILQPDKQIAELADIIKTKIETFNS